jgi:hypothetical protein
MREQTKNEVGVQEEVFAVVTINAGTIDGVAGIFENRGDADIVAAELKSHNRETDVVACQLGKVVVRGTAKGGCVNGQGRKVGKFQSNLAGQIR